MSKKISHSKAFVRELQMDLEPGRTEKVIVPGQHRKLEKRLEKLGAEVQAAGGAFSKVIDNGVSTFSYTPAKEPEAPKVEIEVKQPSNRKATMKAVTTHPAPRREAHPRAS
jgi:hypothetical protein